VVGVTDRLPRVLFATNYSMEKARSTWLAGEAPVQHLWGAPWLEESGHVVRMLPYREPRRSSRWRAAGRSRLGDLDAQVRALLDRERPAVLYAADRDSFALYALLASFGWRRRPTVAVVHPEVLGDRFRRRIVLGHDVAVAISAVVYDQLLALGRPASTTVLLPWGPDLAFPGYQGTTDEFVVSSGKTLRDVPTLLAALDGSGIPARVHVPARGGSPEGVELRVRLPYAEVLSDLRRASIVVIPLLEATGTAGLTELNDALALGKPVVMTRNRFIDVDVEAVGCGIWVDRGDTAGWRAALQRLSADPQLRADMGRRGREFAERSWNAELFGTGLAAAFADLAPR
jgi:glycosyltransferase involved in cell wall biosynthesis